MVAQREWKTDDRIKAIEGKKLTVWRETWSWNEAKAGIPILEKYIFASEERKKNENLIVLSPTEDANPKIRELKIEERRLKWKKLDEDRERKKKMDSKKSEEKDELMWRLFGMR